MLPRRMLSLAAGVALAFSAGAVRAEETTYYVGHQPPKYVNISFQSEADFETILGSSNQASGEIKVDEATHTGSVSLSVPVTSLKTGIDMRDGHLQSAMWLDAAKFPDMTFVSKSVQKIQTSRPENVGLLLDVTGDFTIHGVTKEMTVRVNATFLPADMTEKAKFPAGQWIKFSASFELKLSDFDVKIPEVAAGKVSDTWTLKMVLFAGTSKPQAK